MKLPIIIVAGSFVLMVAGSIAGGILESSGMVTREKLGTEGIAVIIGVYFVLFCLMAFAAVPLFVRGFVAMQTKVGNANVFPIRWLAEHEQTAVWFFWCLFAAGLVIAFVLAKDDILKQIK